MKTNRTAGKAGALFASIASFIFMFTFGPLAIAQENVNGKYKVGDRVQCDFKFNNDYKEGTVVDIVGKGDAGTCCRYRVKIDNDEPAWKDGRLCQERVIRLVGEQTPKPETKSESQQKTGPKPKPDEPVDFTYLADRKPIACPIEQKQVKVNASPNPELLKKIIRCLYEKPAPAGITGAKTVDITDFQIGASRKWIPLSDIGSGNRNTTVYPIKASWTEKTFYESYTQQIDNISMFNCFVNAVGEWECGLAKRIKESDIKRLPPKQ
jgi:hypothetical protein